MMFLIIMVISAFIGLLTGFIISKIQKRYFMKFVNNHLNLLDNLPRDNKLIYIYDDFIHECDGRCLNCDLFQTTDCPDNK